MLTVNIKYNISVNNQGNLCLCNVYSVYGCDLNFVQSRVTLVDIYEHYTLYKGIEPVQLGTNLSLLQQLISHPEMLRQLQALKDEGRDIDLAVHHSATQIETILDRIKRTSKDSWWFRFLNPEASQYNSWKIIFTPVALICVIQGIVFVFIFHLYVTVNKLRLLAGSRPTFVKFKNDADPSLFFSEGPHQGGEL